VDTDKTLDELPEVNQGGASSEDSYLKCLRPKLGLSPEELYEDMVTKPQEDLGKDSLCHLIPT
jgi:hypothetical protein